MPTEPWSFHAQWTAPAAAYFGQRLLQEGGNLTAQPETLSYMIARIDVKPQPLFTRNIGWLVILFQTQKCGAIMTSVTEWASVSLSVNQTGSARCGDYPQGFRMQLGFSLSFLPLV